MSFPAPKAPTLRAAGPLMLALLALACMGGQRSGDEARGPTPTRPPAFTGAVETVPRAVVVAYGESLNYDMAQEAGDEQHLLLPAGSGPLGRVDMEIGAVALSRKALGQGRVIARVTVTGGKYAPLGLAAGVNYLWVDSLAGNHAFREVVVPVDPNAPLVVLPLTLEARSPNYYGPFPIHAARWIETPLSKSPGRSQADTGAAPAGGRSGPSVTTINTPCVKTCCRNAPSAVWLSSGGAGPAD